MDRRGPVHGCHAPFDKSVLFVLPLSWLVHAPSRSTTSPSHPRTRTWDPGDTPSPTISLSLHSIECLSRDGWFLFRRDPSFDSSRPVHVDAALGLGPWGRTIPRHVDGCPYSRGPAPGIFSSIRFVRMSTGKAQDGVTVSWFPAWERDWGGGAGERSRVGRRHPVWESPIHVIGWHPPHVGRKARTEPTPCTQHDPNLGRNDDSRPFADERETRSHPKQRHAMKSERHKPSPTSAHHGASPTLHPSVVPSPACCRKRSVESLGPRHAQSFHRSRRGILWGSCPRSTWLPRKRNDQARD